jgi:hypothetical protein
MRRLTIILTVLCAAVLAAAPAHASSRQLTIMQDDGLLYRSGDVVRDQTLDEFRALGADAVKVQLYWRDVAPPGRRKPAGFDGADPAAYDWGPYDDLVREITARGMQPFLAIGNVAPDWATRRRKPRVGIYRPSAREFQRFAQAVGARYPGVTLWSLWNEPNLFSWLSPQRSKGTPVSPSIYRELYLAGHRGLRASGHSGNTILLGELMPTGNSSRKVPPLEFLREMACLNDDYRPYRGAAAKRRDCPRRLKRIPTSGIAYHPYSLYGGLRGATRTDEAKIATLGRLTKTLDAIARRGKLPRRLPVWITEFGFQTNPPDRLGYRLSRASAFMDESEWLAFRNRRVRSYSQYQLRDDPLSAPWQAGLRFLDGREKRHVYAAFRTPAFVRALGGSRVEVFGGQRALSGGSATIESKTKGSRYRRLGTARLNSAGYFRKVFRVGNANNRTYRITVGGHSRVKRAVRR